MSFEKSAHEAFLGLGCHCILEPKEGKGGLYLSNLKKAEDIPHLLSLNISAMVSVMEDDPPESLCELLNIKNLYIDVLDAPSSRLIDYFEVSSNFIKKELTRGNVQVHCHMGVSRSATLVIAFLMRENRKSAKEAIGIVRERRSCILPNDGFLMQLQEYEEKLKKSHEN